MPAATAITARRNKIINVLRTRRLFLVFELMAFLESMGCGSDGNASGGGDSSSIFFRAFRMELNFAVLNGSDAASQTLFFPDTV